MPTEPSILIIAEESQRIKRLLSELAQNDFTCVITSSRQTEEIIAGQSPNLILVEKDVQSPDARTWELLRSLKEAKHLPMVVLVSEEILDTISDHPDLDDFITRPYHTKELVLRINRLLSRTTNRDSSELIQCDGLVIDLAKCEVTLEGKLIELTFKEYELLKFLASNSGRVFSREALLNQVWGYDYYGGDRTVDVHVRRLRSKIEDPSHSFIETVRNIGYRFKKDV